MYWALFANAIKHGWVKWLCEHLTHGRFNNFTQNINSKYQVQTLYCLWGWEQLNGNNPNAITVQEKRQVLGYMKFQKRYHFAPTFKINPKVHCTFNTDDWSRMKSVLQFKQQRYVMAKKKIYDSKSFKTFRRRSFRNDFTVILGKLFDIWLSYKHCNFTRGCLLVKMAPKTMIRSIDLLTF